MVTDSETDAARWNDALVSDHVPYSNIWTPKKIF